MGTNAGQFKKGEHWRPIQKHWDAEWLRNQYETQQKSSADISVECGITEGAILHWLRKHGIKRRSISEVRAVKHWGVSGSENPMFGKTGKQNPNYKDGSSKERINNVQNKNFAKRIFFRDNYKCRRCGIEKAKGILFHAHHIAPWAGNPDLRFDENNVVTLCHTCHSWVHSKENKNKDFLS